MIARLLLVVLLAAASASAAQERVRIAYVGTAEDPFYDPQPLYTGLSLRDRHRPMEAMEVALGAARILGRALDLDFGLDVHLVPDGAAAAAVSQALDAGALAVLLDLPEAEMDSLDMGKGLLFNIRHQGMRWRQEDCAPRLLHTMPSNAMLADALAQYLSARGWRRVLLLTGDHPDDPAVAAAARRAIAKFGLRLAAERSFVLTNDPRQRNLSNVALLTGGVRHDVVWLIDSDGEFGRYVPYATLDPRPVVGSEGLQPQGWHWTWERHGAPQLNQRFRRVADRDMTTLDWAAWAAIRAMIEGVQRVGRADREAVAAFLRSDSFSLDLYKGAPGSFRRWNGQLRQPLLLATHNAVIERAPLDGFEHQTDTLDTLGVDEAETACQP